MKTIYFLFLAILFSIKTGRADAKTAPIDKEAVRQVMRANLPSFKKCYADELKKNKDLGGKIVIKWEISDEGAVTKALVESSKMNNSTVENCILEKVKTLKFPKPPTGMTGEIRYPFSFQSDK